MDKNIEREKTVLMGFFGTRVSDEEIAYKMDEVELLAQAALLEVCAITIQRRDKIEAATYIGSGKVVELADICEKEGANLLILNVQLSGAQIKNLNDLTGVKVIDRTALILDIFAKRAGSSIAKLQVELAQYKYLLPRLKGFGHEMSGTGAGIGTRGPGEQKLELDRRKMHNKIHDYEMRLKDAENKRQLTKKSRMKSGIKTVSLLGYTNAGKSSLMNYFVDKYPGESEEQKVFVKDMLFATLETYHRRINFENKRSFVLSDTVGFVSDLPHDLVEAFSSTLEEVKNSDLILHIVDISNSECLNQLKTCDSIIEKLNGNRDETLIVLNKFDLMQGMDLSLYKDKISSLLGIDSAQIFELSTLSGFGFNELKNEIEKRLFGLNLKTKLLIPYSEGAVAQKLIDVSDIINTEYMENGTLFEIEISEEDFVKFEDYTL